MKRFVINVLIADRVGVLRDIGSAVADRGGNIDGISQTVVEGYFTVILTASFATDDITAEQVRQTIATRFGPEASVTVRDHQSPRDPLAGIACERYVVTLHGSDRIGLIKDVMTFLSGRKINVEDWYVSFAGDQVTHIGEVTVPSRLDIQQVQTEFRTLLGQHGLSCSFQHVNLFRVTSEVAPVRTILSETSHAGSR